MFCASFRLSKDGRIFFAKILGSLLGLPYLRGVVAMKR